MRSLLFALLLFFVTPANADRLSNLAALKHTDYFSIEARDLKRPFHIYVRTPLDYDETDTDYPVVYLLDGDITFPIIGAYHYLLQYDEKAVPEAIIVGISYGSFDPDNGNFRAIDYSTPPLDDGDPHGGASTFQRFLKYELIPRVEKTYRADASRRIIMGQSRGGHFGLYSAMTNPDLFWGRIISNPSFEPNKDLFFADETLPDPAPVKVYLSSAQGDWPELKTDAKAWMSRWQYTEPPWQLKFAEPEGMTHAASIVHAYRDGMKWLFESEAAE